MMALGAIITEHPHWAHPDLADLYLPVRDAHPVFYGAYDWHSAVHSHWTLARLADLDDDNGDAIHLLASSITRQSIIREVATMASGVLDRFEIPYGMAWVLMLERALADNRESRLHEVGEAVRPLADLARRRLSAWLTGLDMPVESRHNHNTAFSLALIRDSRDPLWATAVEAAGRWWKEPTGRMLVDEVGPYDFNSPTLEAADVMTSILDPDERERWLRSLLPSIESQLEDFEPVVCSDPADGRAGHLLGLNLSRARALHAIADRLEDGPLPASLRATADRHLTVGLQALEHTHFAVTHWMATFALRALDV